MFSVLSCILLLNHQHHIKTLTYHRVRMEETVIKTTDASNLIRSEAELILEKVSTHCFYPHKLY